MTAGIRRWESDAAFAPVGAAVPALESVDAQDRLCGVRRSIGNRRSAVGVLRRTSAQPVVRLFRRRALVALLRSGRGHVDYDQLQ